MMANNWKTDNGIANLEAQFQSLLKQLKKEKQPVDEDTNTIDKTPILLPILPTPEFNLRVYGEPVNKKKWTGPL